MTARPKADQHRIVDVTKAGARLCCFMTKAMTQGLSSAAVVDEGVGEANVAAAGTAPGRADVGALGIAIPATARAPRWRR